MTNFQAKNKIAHPSFKVMISSSFYLVLVTLTTIFAGGFGGLFFPIRKWINHSILTFQIGLWAKLNLFFLRICCDLNHQIHGQENLKRLLDNDERFIVMSNHQSAWDIMICIKCFPRTTFVTKKSLLWIPFLGWGLAILNPITIDRSKRINSMRILLQQGVQRLRKGYTLVIFPEGTRQTSNRIGNYHMGGVKVAQRAKVKILPVVHNASNFWSRRSLWRYPGTIQMVIGEPIDATSYDARELTKSIEEWSRTQLDLIKQNNPQPQLGLGINNINKEERN